jgi:hypothetical protein
MSLTNNNYKKFSKLNDINSILFNKGIGMFFGLKFLKGIKKRKEGMIKIVKNNISIL